MRCIICQKEKSESEEHIIPEALGNKKLITMRVCERCNNRLGSNVDNYLTDHPLVKLLRIENDLSGKKGKDIKFFEGVETDVDTGQKYSMKNNKPVLQPRVVPPENGNLKIEASNFEEGMKFVRKLLKRQGYANEKIDEICSDAIYVQGELLAPKFRKDIIIDFAKLGLAAIKIAYEYAFEQLGEEYLEDEVAKLFARELYKAAEADKNDVKPSNELARFVTYPISGSGVEKLLAEQRETLKSTSMNILHTIFFIKQDNSLYCVLNLCMTDVISFVVKVTENADKYKGKLPASFVFKDGSQVTL